MGRVKLKIKRLENTGNRQVTYSKRRNGILKKAQELSILCDIDIILLMFSPTGKPTLFRGEHSNVEEVIAKFAQLTPQERAKRKLESLEALKKTFKKLDHGVNIQEFLGSSAQSVEELANQVRTLQAQLTEVYRRLSCWSSPEKIDYIEQLMQMEDSLKESLNRVRMHKFQNGMHLPLTMARTPEGQPLSWLPINDNQHMIFPVEPNCLPQRDIGCSSDPSIPTYSGCFDSCKTEIENTRQVDNTGQECGSFNKLDSSSCLALQLNEQFPYHPYSSLNLLEVKKIKSETGMNLHNPLNYQFNNSFGLHRPVYENVSQSWFHAPEPCGISIFGENSYEQSPH